eukprot:gene17711-biopygen9890
MVVRGRAILQRRVRNASTGAGHRRSSPVRQMGRGGGTAALSQEVDALQAGGGLGGEGRVTVPPRVWQCMVRCNGKVHDYNTTF